MRLALIGIVGLVVAPAAWAVLGESEASIDAYKTALHAETRTLSSDPRFRVHTLTVAGTTVKEFATLDGTVFAVRWQGQTRPDLSHLLGTRFKDYTDETAKTKKVPGRRPLEVSTSGLVVRHGGHMGNIKGEAFIPSLIPAGVDVESLP